MTKAAEKLHPDDAILTLSDDGKTAEIKKDEPKVAEEKRESEEGDDEEESQEDQRHAVSEDGEDLESRRAARRDARRARKQHRREREAAKDAELAELRTKLDTLNQRVGAGEKTNANQTLAIVDSRIAEANQAIELADTAIEIAVKDGKGMREALKARDVAIEARRQLNDYKTNFVAATRNGAQQQQGEQGPSAALLNHAKRFKQDNPWIDFNIQTDDPDSQKAHRLDASVRAAGYNPETPEYWEELQDRVDRAFPDRLTDMADEAEEQERAPRRTNGGGNGVRRGPAMSGGRSAANLGKNDVVIPKDVKEACQAAGYWNDPKDRADFIKRWKASKEKYGART